MTNPVLECRNVVREFSEGVTTLQVLRGVNLAVQPAERVAIIGSSGSGKTTLLQIMGGLDDPSEGGVLVNGAAMHGTTETAKGELRNRYIGFIYQFHHLLPEFTAEENVAMPLLIRRESRPAAFEAALTTLVGDTQQAHEVSINQHGGISRPPKPVDRKAQKLFDLVRDCGASLGQTIGWQSTGGVCDGNNIASCGVPVVDTMGVRGGAIHSPDEFMIVSSLRERAALSALVIHRLASGEEL